MARVYSVQFTNVSISAVQDLIAAYCGASMAIRMKSIVLGQVTATAIGNLRISVKRLPATVTAGSGGSTPTPQKEHRGDAAATFTAHTNDTAQATTSGTAVTLHSDVYNPINGYQWVFPPDDMPDAGLSEALVLSLDTAPGAAQTTNGTVVFEELF